MNGMVGKALISGTSGGTGDESPPILPPANPGW
jgi:hypothetical protein